MLVNMLAQCAHQAGKNAQWLWHINASSHSEVRCNGPAHIPLKIVPSHGGSVSNLIHGFLIQHESTTQTSWQLVEPFLHRSSICPTHRHL